jgi:hypothetical protein
MSAPVIIFNRDLEFSTTALPVNTGAVADIALFRVKGAKGIVHLEGIVGGGGALSALLIAGCARQDGAPQPLANSAATPASDFASDTYRKPGNSVSPETTAAGGSFWIDLLADGLSDIVVRASAAAATTITFSGRITERGRIG